MGVVDHRIGTVPDLSDGTFKLELPDEKGEILVHNARYKKFNFKYNVEQTPKLDFSY